MTRAKGIDISKWQVSFQDQGNIDFIIIKCSEGLAKDPLFDQFCQDVQGIERRAAYHYFRTGVDPIEQAEFFHRAQGNQGFKWLAVDYEKTHNTLDAGAERDLQLFWVTLEGLTEKPLVLY